MSGFSECKPPSGKAYWSFCVTAEPQYFSITLPKRIIKDDYPYLPLWVPNTPENQADVQCIVDALNRIAERAQEQPK